jgi:hypothetical protein
VFLENISDPRLMRRISAETGARVGGTLYSDSLTDEKGDAPTYIDMVRHNIKALTRALATRAGALPRRGPPCRRCPRIPFRSNYARIDVPKNQKFP